MSAAELLKQAKLGEAIDEVSVALRQDPTDKQARTFLFELLCFTGDLDRANKHLELVAHDSKESKTGGLLYHAALQAERTRQDAFEGKLEGGPSLDADKPAQAKVKGTFNGAPFEAIGDADPRIGGQLEVIAGLDYLWVPFEHIVSIDMVAPRRLRDLYWAPARVETGPKFQGQTLGEVLLPALAPQSYLHPDEEVQLGRVSVWARDEDGVEAPYGLKMLVVDGVERPLLDLRELRIEAVEG
ncbi:MAG: virulence protein SciE type [Bryobacterales bacterium]|nr:virulence protein SciE type [Bryobacterales bacterium]